REPEAGGDRRGAVRPGCGGSARGADAGRCRALGFDEPSAAGQRCRGGVPGQAVDAGDRIDPQPGRAADPDRPARVMMRPAKLVQRFLLPGFVISIIYALRFRAMVSPRAEVELSPLLKLGKG